MLLNTIVADSLNYVADLIETEIKKGSPLQKAVQTVVTKVLKENKGSIFNGNGYSEEWKKEAKARNLFNLPSSPEAFAVLVMLLVCFVNVLQGSEKNKKMFADLGVLNNEELMSHQHILYENYVKALNVEGQCLANMAQTYILPGNAPE